MRIMITNLEPKDNCRNYLPGRLALNVTEIQKVVGQIALAAPRTATL